MKKVRDKNCGVLLAVSSLPSPYGIGDLGDEAYAFVDFLRRAGQKYWQVLPIGATSYGDSPYQSPSAFAGNEYFISLRALLRDGLLGAEELRSQEAPVGKIDYGKIFTSRRNILLCAYERFEGDPDPRYAEFCRENAYWLDSYALFCAIKRDQGLKPHYEWSEEYRDRCSEAVARFADCHRREIDFVKFLQYRFDSDWRALREYAHSEGVSLIGDAPIYVAYDSVDFWAEPQAFLTDGHGNPTLVAGVPPDYFSESGQLWGNPIYDWEYMRERGYGWWRARIERARSLYDSLRIDHFRAFESYYAVKFGKTDAREGEWRKGPGKELFDSLGDCGLDIIAEDLGLVGEDVHKLVRDCGFPGMKVLQFGFDGDAAGNPHSLRNFDYDSVGYTGTHDNDTTLGWYLSRDKAAREGVRRRLGCKAADVPRAMIEALYRSRVRTAIVPMQDWLGEGSDARMNTPGTAEGNWRYRLSAVPPDSLAEQMRALARSSGRLVAPED